MVTVVIQIFVKGSSTYCISKARIAFSILATQTLLAQVDWPHSVNYAIWKTTTIVIWTAKLLTSENAELEEHEKHKEKSIEELGNRAQ